MSLFKRPAWAKQQVSDNAGEDKAEENIFSHSGSYQAIVAEQEKRKREKAEKRKAKAEKAERRSSEKREIKDESKGDSTAKRRRITSKESETLLRRAGLPPIELNKSDEDEQVNEGTPVRRSPRKNRDAVKPPRTTVIDLGGSSEEDSHVEIQMSPGAPQAVSSAPVEEVQDESDDEFAELARKARLQRQQSNNRSSNTHNTGVVSPSPGLGPSHKPPDPTIQLFISSPLPGTNPLIVHRKLSQPTAAIRHAWCQKQGFAKEFADTVFFIHRMRRVYDVTTCRSLGLDVDQYGNVTMKGAEGKEGVERVMLEAVTDEIFQQMKEQKAKESAARSAPEVEQEFEPVVEKEKSNIKIILKAKNLADFNLKVKPSTEMRKIALAYAKRHLQDEERQVRLEFDGEELDPDDQIKDTEIEDGMSIDVYML